MPAAPERCWSVPCCAVGVGNFFRELDRRHLYVGCACVKLSSPCRFRETRRDAPPCSRLRADPASTEPRARTRCPQPPSISLSIVFSLVVSEAHLIIDNHIKTRLMDRAAQRKRGLSAPPSRRPTSPHRARTRDHDSRVQVIFIFDFSPFPMRSSLRLP